MLSLFGLYMYMSLLNTIISSIPGKPETLVFLLMNYCASTFMMQFAYIGVLRFCLQFNCIKQALKDQRRVVTAFWLNDVLVKKKMLPPYQALHLPIIYGENKPCSNQVNDCNQVNYCNQVNGSYEQMRY